MLKIGITGTRVGLTPHQNELVHFLFSFLKMTGEKVTIIHGDCRGVDMEVHILAVYYKYPVVIHPCNLEHQRAHCSGAVTTYPPKDPLERNKDIVNECDFLLVIPRTSKEERRSGTWMTYRYAKKVGKHVMMCYPEATDRVNHFKAVLE